MASFEQHMEQAKHNLAFLELVNHNSPLVIDWQITICFYTSLHLINAHIAKVCNLHYNSHSDTINAINSDKPGKGKLPENISDDYRMLMNLSRKARYLTEGKNRGDISVCFLVKNKDLRRAVKLLDGLLGYFSVTYQIDFPKHTLYLPGATSTIPNTNQIECLSSERMAS